MCLPRLAYNIEFVRAWTDDNSHSSTTVYSSLNKEFNPGQRTETEVNRNWTQRNPSKSYREARPSDYVWTCQEQPL